MLTLAVLLLTGCASSSGSLHQLSAPTTEVALVTFTKLSLETAMKGDLPMTSVDRERIVSLVLRRLKERAPHRFAEAAAPDERVLRAVITFTRYDEGSAFAPVMLAGLGQIHIDAEVTLEAPAKQQRFGTYEVTKTFAWGGLYGGMTRITDVEAGFADAVVDLLLGEGKAG